MTSSRLLAALLLTLMAGSLVGAQDKKPDKKPAGKDSKKATPPVKIWNPYDVFLQYKLIAALDKDENGSITMKEAEVAVEALKKLDANSDGKLEASEYLMEKLDPKSMAPRFKAVKAIDADGDTVFSAEEIAKAVEVLKKLDANGDGKLESPEYAAASSGGMGQAIGPDGKPMAGGPPGGGRGGGRAMPTPEEFIKQNDKNSDGKVAKAELTGPAANFFDRMDENKDGFVTLEEVKASRERMRQQNGAGGAPPATAPKGEPKSDSPK